MSQPLSHPRAADPHADDRWVSAGGRIARGAALRAGGEVVGKVASMAFFVVMARELGQARFGEFMFALSLSTVVMFASGFGTEELVAREVARDRSRVHAYLPNVVAAKFLASVGLLGVVAVIVELSDFSAQSRVAAFLVALGVAIENLGRSWHSIFTAYERVGMISISLVAQRTLTAAAGITALLTGGGLVTAAAVFAGGALAGLAIAMEVLRRRVVDVHWRFDRARWLPLLRAGVPIGMASLLFTALLRLDASLLGFLAPDDARREVGAYGAAFRLVEATLFVSWAFSASMLPWLARRDDGADVARSFGLAAKAITAVLMPVGLLTVFLAAEIIDLLYGGGYKEAVMPLRLMGVLVVLFGINQLSATVLISRDRPHDETRALLVVLAQNVVANVVLIPRYGADGAAFSAALSAVLLAALNVALLRRRFGAVRPVRVFAGPAVGSAAMVAAVTLVDLPVVPAAAVALAAYAATAAGFEYAAYPEDLRRLRRIVATATVAASTRPADRGSP